jgi:CRISPR-associated protein Cmr3
MIVLKPYDVFIFSDGKPFNKGEETFRESVFFINPIPILSFANKLTKNKFNIQFISLIKDNTLYFKVPLEIKKLKYRQNLITPKLKTIDETYITKEDITHILDYETEEKMEDLSGYIDVDTFVKYLKGEDLKSIENLVRINSEIRTGIELSKTTRTTVEGMLYSQNFVRFPENLGFYVKFDKEIDTDFFTLGGEGKIFKTEKVQENLTKSLENVKDEIKTKIKQKKIFKIILLTPTNALPKIEGAKLVAKVIGKPITYSGWISHYKDELKTSVLPTRIFRLIPEGSVFYYQLEDESKLEEIFNKYWLKPAFMIKEYPYFDTNNPSGFGLTIIGTIY